MPTPELEQALALLIGAGAGGSGVWGWRRVKSQNRRDDAESARVLAQAYALFVDDLRKELAATRAEAASLRERVAALETHISVLLNDARQRESLATPTDP